MSENAPPPEGLETFVENVLIDKDFHSSPLVHLLLTEQLTTFGIKTLRKIRAGFEEWSRQHIIEAGTHVHFRLLSVRRAVIAEIETREERRG